MLRRVIAIGLAITTSALGGSALGQAAPPQPILCTLPSGTTALPPGARHGLIQHMRQYPAINLASSAQRARAVRILAQLRATAKKESWRDMDAVGRAGYKVRPRPRKPGDLSTHYFHAEYTKQRGGRFTLDPGRPKALIFANAPGAPLVLVGAMWSMRRGERGPTPAGPIVRWHSHVVCVVGEKRGTKPLAGGACPAGARLRQGTEMLHVWFTGALRSAFSTSAPVPELCKARVLGRGSC
jgi:hypothetical protein